MKIYLTDQSKNFGKHLDLLRAKDVIKYDKAQLVEKTTIVGIHPNKELKEFDTSFFWAYNIFPSNIMMYLTEWSYENREIRVGDTIVQQAFIPPIIQFSQKVIFGVRINKIIDESNKIGFSYETLQGHVEMGESTFTIEKTLEGKVIFKIQTFSKPGNFLTRIIGTIFSVPYQTFCTRKGLQNVKRQLEQQSK